MEDDLRCEFHLTPRGWVAGTRSFFDKVQGGALQRPDDAVATYLLHITQKSAFSRENRIWKEVWRREGSDTEIEVCLQKWDQPTEDSKLPHE